MKYLWAMFATSALTVSLCGAVVFLFPSSVYEASYAQFEHAREMTAERSDARASWVAVGDSRAKAALLTTGLGPNAVSLTMAGASPIELYYTTARYLDGHPAPEHAVVSFAPVHFHSQFLFWGQTIKFGYLEESEVEEVFEVSDSLGDDSFGGPLFEQVEYGLHRINFLHLYLPELKAAALHSRASVNAEVLARLRVGRGHLFFGTEERAGGAGYESAHESFVGAPIYDHYLRRLLDLLLAAGVEVRYQAMPVNRLTHESIRAGYMRSYEAFMANVARDYPRMRFDYRLPVLPDEYFGDDNHANRRGAELVTRCIREGRDLSLPRIGS